MKGKYQREMIFEHTQPDMPNSAVVITARGVTDAANLLGPTFSLQVLIDAVESVTPCTTLKISSLTYWDQQKGCKRTLKGVS